MNYFIENISSVIKSAGKVVKRDYLKIPITNYFETQFQETVLLSYITNPFKHGSHFRHTNSIEALEIANIFKNLHFNVDIANYDYEGHLKFDNYNVVFGFGEPLMKSFSAAQKKIVRIFYGTGKHFIYQNHNSLKRIKDVFEKKGIWMLDSGRLADKTWSPCTTLVDGIIALGNAGVAESYKQFFDGEVYANPASFFLLYNYLEIISKKNFATAKNHFLWFGSSGAIHKGLDLLLEFFAHAPNLHLHICGPLEREPEFTAAYHNELFNTKNITVYGFVEINSPVFKELLEKCAFVIYPTCSEGGSPSVLNVSGNGGLIPIVTKEATIDIDDFGIAIDSLELSGLTNAVTKALSFSEEKLKQLSTECGKTISERHSLKNFSLAMESNIKSILKSCNNL